MSHSAVTLTCLAAPLIIGCAHTPPQFTSGPTLAASGVSVALVSQACDQNKDPDFWGNDLVELSVDLSLRNPTPQPVTIYRDRIRVLAPDGIAARTVTWKASEPIQLASAESVTIPLRFMNRGSLTCDGPLAMDLDTSIVANDKPLRLPPIRFVAGP